MSATVGTHSGAGPLSLMSCVRESSPLQDYGQDNEKNVVSKRKFWNPKKWFRRKNKPSEDVIQVEVQDVGKDPLRSRSTSELSVDEDQTRRRSSSSIQPGLSVSHDSVFQPLNSGSDVELDAAQSVSSLSISQPLGDPKLQIELSERLRLRRSGGGGASSHRHRRDHTPGGGATDEDDEGLPRSPCNSPTSHDHHFLIDKTACKDLPTKSHSTCSDGSLLSMGSSSEIDEDSFGLHSRHSSKLSLQEKKIETESEWELHPTVSVPLNHSAAHHRVAVRPKRTYGAPRRKRGQQLSSALPATPEVNEDSSVRSTSPENNMKEALSELYSTSSSTIATETNNQLKCFSLPSGIAPPSTCASSKLIRSKSNAGSKSEDTLLPLTGKEGKPSLFERIFPRRSGKKKKKEEKEHKEDVSYVTEKQEHKAHVTVKSRSETSTCSTTKWEEYKPAIAPRTGAAARQRVQPMDIPVTPKDTRESTNINILSSPEKQFSGSSPIHTELETFFKQRQISLSSSPPDPPSAKNTPPHSPRFSVSPKSSVITTRSDYSYSTKTSTNLTKYSEIKDTKIEDFRSKIKIPTLASLQQRVLNVHDSIDENDTGFTSLTNFSDNKVKPVTKSHSFKSTKPQFEDESSLDEKKAKRKSVTKASSLDSFKNLEDSEDNHTETFKQKSESVLISKDIDDTDTKKICDSITISGPSHTAVVNIKTNSEDYSQNTSTSESEIIDKDGVKTFLQKESQVSITKIQLKHETTQVTKGTITIPKDQVPEFINKQLNKVEKRPFSNIVFSMKSPKIFDEQSRPKTLLNFDGDLDNSKPPIPRKTSKESIDSTDNEQAQSPPKTPPAPIQQRFKKNDSRSSSRKSSVISIQTSDSSCIKEKSLMKSRSISLDSLKSDRVSEMSSSQDSLDKTDVGRRNCDNVVLRRKSLAKQKNEEEPELMKVFARRSLKLKDSEIDQLQEQLKDMKSKDSDKENSDTYLESDVKNITTNTKEEECKCSVKEHTQKEALKLFSLKEPDVQAKKSLFESRLEVEKTIAKEEPEVQLRKPLSSNAFLSHRSVSLNPSKTNNTEIVMKKQSSFSERRRTDQWITNVKNDEPEKDRLSEEIITRSDIIEELKTETKNVSQRKAEWEKRAQLAQKKTIP